MRIEHTVTIEAPVDEVFHYVASLEHTPEWVGPVDGAHQTSDGPMEVGTTFEHDVTFLHKHTHLVYEVTAYDEPRALAYRSIAGPHHSSYRFSFEPTTGGTRLMMVFEGEPEWFYMISRPLMYRITERQTHGDFARLKELLEAGVAG